MKYLTNLYRFIVLALLLGTTAAVVAQDYSPTAVEGANWIIIDSETHHFPYSTFVRSVQGDTILDGITYKKLYQQVVDYIETQFGPALTPPYEVFPDKELIALLRDDVDARRVYGRIINLGQENSELSSDTLFHDYSLAVGERPTGYFFLTDFVDGDLIEEVGEDFVYGEMRRFQQIGNVRFYEGIGSPELGPTSGDYSFYLNCCRWRLIDYCAGQFADCNIVSSTLTLPGNVDISVFPNPFTNHINLDLPNGTPANPIAATLRDLTGRVLRTTTLTTNLNWSVADLPAGVYLVTLSDGRVSETLKMVKR